MMASDLGWDSQANHFEDSLPGVDQTLPGMYADPPSEAPLDQISADDLLTWVHDASTEQRERNITVDLLNEQPLEFEISQGQVLQLEWDPALLQRLMGSVGTVAVNIRFDASMWQLIETSSLNDDVDSQSRDGTVSGDHDEVTLGLAPFQLLSKANQTGRLVVNLHPADPSMDGHTEIVLTLDSLEESPATRPDAVSPIIDWTESVVDVLIPSDLMGSSLLPGDRIDSNTDHEVDDVDGVLPTTESDGSSPSATSDVTTFSGESTDSMPPQSHSQDRQSSTSRSELPRSDRPDRTIGRSASRSLDLRPSAQAAWGGASWGASNQSNRPVTDLMTSSANKLKPEGFDGKLSSSQSKWIADPKPAKLQSATFLLSRVRKSDAGTMQANAKPNAGQRPTATQHENEIQPVHWQRTQSVSTDVITPTEVKSNHLPPSDDKVSVHQPEEDVRLRADDIPSRELLRDSIIPITSQVVELTDRSIRSPFGFVFAVGLTMMIQKPEPNARRVMKANHRTLASISRHFE